MGLKDLVYGLYARRLAARLPRDRVPRHVGVVVDGNRRWARATGARTDEGHRAGASKITEFLAWCDDAGVGIVTVFLLSTDNFQRSPEELEVLLPIVEEAVDGVAATGRWRVNPVGSLDLLPASTARRLKEVADATAGTPGMVVNLAVGYGGRREIADAVRSLLAEHAARGATLEDLADLLDVDHIAEHLYTRGQPDPDLIIRTSGEQRLSGFLLWQSAHSEFWFCDAYWPDFRQVDLLRALRDYARRERRYGA